MQIKIELVMYFVNGSAFFRFDDFLMINAAINETTKMRFKITAQNTVIVCQLCINLCNLCKLSCFSTESKNSVEI